MEATQADKNVFGTDVRLHPITNMPLEQGVGHAPDDVQAWAHCDVIEREHGKKAADDMRAKLSGYVKNPEAPALTRAKAKAEKAQDEAIAAKANADAKAKIAEAAKANVEVVRKEVAGETAKPIPPPTPIFPVQ